MKSQKLNTWIRITVLICALALFVILEVPIWRIELTAPQYPEGLVMKIFAGKLGGDVQIINGLNHYIGMKTLHAEDFMEFTVLPYIIGFFGLLGIVVAIINRKIWLNIFTGLFLAFAILSMVDFWRWEYNYGHNLDSHAAIQVPGMSYQPPLLGYKQLLNFSAFSIPGTGGWIFIGVGVVLFSVTVVQWAVTKKQKVTGALAVILILVLNSCNTGPQPIALGRENCSFCKMTISDNRFGAELITSKGKVYKFDDAHCMLEFIKSGSVEAGNIKAYYLVDFDKKHELISSASAFLLQSPDLHTPMNGNIAAFSSIEERSEALEKYKGSPLEWNDLIK